MRLSNIWDGGGTRGFKFGCGNLSEDVRNAVNEVTSTENSLIINHRKYVYVLYYPSKKYFFRSCHRFDSKLSSFFKSYIVSLVILFNLQDNNIK